jgi:hypothetical protein
MTLIELVKDSLREEEKIILPYLDFSKSDSEIIESMKLANKLNFGNEHENSETK